MLGGQAEILARFIHKLRARFAVRFRRSRHFRNSLPDQSVRDDHLRLAVVALLRLVQSAQECGHVLAIDFLDIETVGLKALAGILALRRGRHRIERNCIRIVNEDQIIQAEVAREGARLRGDAFLQTAITGEADDVLIKNLMLGGIEPGRRHFGCDGDADRVSYALAERPRGAFHAGRF